MGTFQLPDVFNYRLRRAVTPDTGFGLQQPSRKFGIAGPTFEENSWGQPETSQDQLPSFQMAMPDYSKLYDEIGPATQRYQQHLTQTPDMKDYAPSKWRRFGAIMSGIGTGMRGGDGYSTAREINLDPYKTAYENWMGRGQGLKEAATLEEGAASRKATIYQKILSDYMDQQRWNMDYEVKIQNANTNAERNRLIAARDKMNRDHQLKIEELTGARDRDTAKFHAGSLANQSKGLGIQEDRIFHDSIQGALDRASREKVAGMRGDTGVSGSEQGSIEQQSLRAAVADLSALGENPTDYFMGLGTYLIPIKPLPPEIDAKHRQRIALGQQTAIGKVR